MNDSVDAPETIPWRAQEGPQLTAIQKHWVFELFFGGAVGGGKSDFLLGDFAQDVPTHGAAWHGILFRKSYPQLEELVARSKMLYPAWFGLDAQKCWTSGNHMWRWPNGATLKFRHAEDDDAWMEYQGHQYPWMGFDELPHWATPTFYRELKTRVRSAHGIPNMRIRSTGNPGGLGHGWIKQYWQIDKYPLGGQLIPKDKQGGARMFIRSKVTDNKILMEQDPGYIERLQGLGSEALVQQYLDGDWNVIAGAYFPEFNANKHIVAPFEIPKNWMRFCAMDWGSSTPFCVIWYAVSDGSIERFPRGALIAYREWYGASQNTGDINVGLKMTAEEVGVGIIEREALDEQLSMRVLDPSAFKQESGPSIAERMARVRFGERRGPDFQKADNSRKAGWDQMRARLKGEDSVPMIYWFSTCVDSIRTVPMLQHDRGKKAGAMEDVDTDSEDHCFAAGTLVSTPGGPVPIEKLSETGVVDTRFGVCEYRSAAPMGVQPTLKLSFSDGSCVVCTPDHRFLSEDGWTKAENLKGRWLRRSSSRITVKSFLAFATTVAGSIFSAKESGSIELFGNITLAQSLKAGTSTMPTRIGQTTIRLTCGCCLPVHTCGCMANSKTYSDYVSNSTNGQERQPLNGTDHPKAESGTAKTLLSTLLPFVASLSQKIVSFAGRSTELGHRALNALLSAARSANHVRCANVEPQPEQVVYCLTVPTTAEFLLSSGLVVSNCGDTNRYACMARPWIPKSQKVEPRKYEKGVMTTTTTFNELVQQKRAARLENE